LALQPGRQHSGGITDGALLTIGDLSRLTGVSVKTVAIINGWPAAPSVMPAAKWLIAALRAASGYVQIVGAID
jgi:hypothetical protein